MIPRRRKPDRGKRYGAAPPVPAHLQHAFEKSAPSRANGPHAAADGCFTPPTL